MASNATMNVGTQTNRALRYLLAYAATLALCLSPFCLSIIFLWRSGEVVALRRAVAEQQASGAILGLATYQNFFKYKAELVRQRGPATLVLGSSRTMQFREQMLIGPMANAGGAMNGLNEGLQFLRQLEQPPKVLVLGLDFWWFSESWKGGPEDHSTDDADELSAFRVREPLRWLGSGRLRPEQFAALLMSGDRTNPFTNDQGLGVLAIESASGFRRDGSYQYGNHYFGLFDNLDVRFGITLSRLERTDSIFPTGSHIPTSRAETLAAILEWAAQHQVKVVFILPPLAPPVHERMAAAGAAFRYVSELPELVRQLSANAGLAFEFYDFHGGPSGDDPCEYIDGIHGGDVTFARVLQDILTAAPRGLLGGVVNTSAVSGVIAAFQGHSVSVFPPARFNRPEGDYLGLGCRGE